MSSLQGAVIPLVLVLVAATSVYAQEEAAEAVTATLEWEPGTIGSYRSHKIEFTAKPPEGIDPLPGVTDARYASIRLGDVRPLLLALDASPKEPRLWVDADFDGDLSDERAATWGNKGVTRAVERTVLVPFSDDPVPVPVALYFFRPGDAHGGPVSYYAKAHRTGEVVFAGRLRKVALIDADGDLCFDDVKRAHFYVDVDGNGAFAAGHGTHEHIHFDEPFPLGGATWSATVPDAPGSRLVFTRAGDAPPTAARKWKKMGTQQAGKPQTPPTESFDELAKRFEEESGLAYNQRSATIQHIGRTGDPAALPLLLRVIHDDPTLTVRTVAARALGNPAYLEKGAADAVKLARGNPPALAAAAIQALHGMGYPGREKLFLELMKSSEAAVLGAAAKHLAYDGTEAAKKAIRAAWPKASTPAHRYQVYLAMRYLEEGPPPEVMVAAADEAYPVLQGYALRDLYAIRNPAAMKLAIAAAERRPVVDVLALAAVEVLGADGDAEAVAALVDLADAGSARVQGEIVKRLAPIRTRVAIDVLLKSLRSKSANVRTLAAQILAGIPESYVTDVLLSRAGKERNEETAAAMVEALGDHGDPRAIDLLLRAAGKTKRPLLRVVAIRALARMGLEQPKVREFFLKLLSSKQWEDRVFAIDAAAAAGDTKLVRKLLPNLGHDRRQVRLAVAQAFGTLRAPEPVKPMIDRLGKEELERVRLAIAAALFRITGMNLYDEAALWQQWWKDTGGNFKVPDEIPQLPKVKEGATGAAFYGIPIDSDHVSFVIDQSGSMGVPDATGLRGSHDGSQTRFDVAVREALGALGQLDSKAYANVILFHSTVHPWHDELKKLTPKSRKALNAHLLKQRPTGGTNLYDGVETALLDPEVDTVLLLSDGVPGAGRFVATDDILRAVRRLNQTRRIAIHCVSLGRESKLMRLLAEQNGGEYVRR